VEVKIPYVSLEEARAEAARRWSDVDLRKRVESELGEHFRPEFRERSCGVLWRFVASPDNGFTFFMQLARWVGVQPLVLEYRGDRFFHFNAEKYGLGRLRVRLADGGRGIVDLVDMRLRNGKRIDEVLTRTGETLPAFHHRLLALANDPVEVSDNTAWAQCLGTAAEYYYPNLCHFVAHGVLFETFDTDTEEDSFTRGIILPALERIERTFGVEATRGSTLPA